jgi:hypothetical protein
MNKNQPFGGKVIVLGGDFRQITPVFNHANKIKIIKNTIKSGSLWKHFTILKLYINMRVEAGEQQFIFCAPFN